MAYPALFSYHKTAVSPATTFLVPATPQQHPHPNPTDTHLHAENARLRATRVHLTTILNETTATVQYQRARREQAEGETLREQALARVAWGQVEGVRAVAEGQRRRALWWRGSFVGLLVLISVIVVWWGLVGGDEAEYVRRLRRRRLGLE